MLSPDALTKEPPTPPAAHDPSVAMPAHSRGKKFLSYYKPYMGLFLADMACALIVSAITLLLPLSAQYITKNLLEGNTPHALDQIYLIGALMLALVGVHDAVYHVHRLSRAYDGRQDGKRHAQ